MFSLSLRSLVFMALCGSCSSVFAHTKAESATAQLFTGLDSPAAKVVQQFHHALQSGDAATVLSVLADDVLIYEGGSVERSKAEYQQHHLNADINYLKALRVDYVEHQVKIQGDSAVSVSRSRTVGSYKQKPVDRVGMETITLERIAGRWLITHIHWSN